MPVMKDVCKHEGKRVLLVEGRTDCFVIDALTSKFGLSGGFGIYECGSDVSLLKRLNALILQPDPPEVIGVVLDADYPGIDRRWQQVRQKLKPHPYVFPKTPSPDGTMLENSKEGLPLIGIWFMPDNRRTGMLEDFLLEMVGETDLKMAENCVDNAREKGAATYKDVHHSKALIHTWLSWQDEPGRPLGQAITANVLKPGSPSAKEFADWLRRLFKNQ